MKFLILIILLFPCLSCSITEAERKAVCQKIESDLSKALSDGRKAIVDIGKALSDERKATADWKRALATTGIPNLTWPPSSFSVEISEVFDVMKILVDDRSQFLADKNQAYAYINKALSDERKAIADIRDDRNQFLVDKSKTLVDRSRANADISKVYADMSKAYENYRKYKCFKDTPDCIETVKIMSQAYADKSQVYADMSKALADKNRALVDRNQAEAAGGYFSSLAAGSKLSVFLVKVIQEVHEVITGEDIKKLSSAEVAFSQAQVDMNKAAENMRKAEAAGADQEDPIYILAIFDKRHNWDWYRVKHSAYFKKSCK